MRSTWRTMDNWSAIAQMPLGFLQTAPQRSEKAIELADASKPPVTRLPRSDCRKTRTARIVKKAISVAPGAACHLEPLLADESEHDWDRHHCPLPHQLVRPPVFEVHAQGILPTPARHQRSTSFGSALMLARGGSPDNRCSESPYDEPVVSVALPSKR